MESKSSIFLPNTKKMWKERIIFVHMKIEEDYSIKKHTTFGIDADVSYYVEYDSEEELKELIESGFLLDREVLALGGGSNILFCDDFDGVVLHSEIKGMEIVERKEDSVLVKVGAGEVWDDFVAWTITQGFYGAENLSDIPGSVGATPVRISELMVSKQRILSNASSALIRKAPTPLLSRTRNSLSATVTVLLNTISRDSLS